VTVREIEAARSASLFASPLLSHVWSDAATLNPLLSASITEHARLHPGTALTNYGGWHSDYGRLEFCGSAGEQLLAHMHEMIEEATRRLYVEFGQQPQETQWRLSVWANINRRGDFNQVHTHPGATWSGVYYVDHGNGDVPAPGTPIQLFDPDPARTNIFFPELSASSITLRPEPGLMILFPSYVPHAVPPHDGDHPRISVAFNVRREPFP
jgi:uncharacterized protein (TIGR02466 family)